MDVYRLGNLSSSAQLSHNADTLDNKLTITAINDDKVDTFWYAKVPSNRPFVLTLQLPQLQKVGKISLNFGKKSQRQAVNFVVKLFDEGKEVKKIEIQGNQSDVISFKFKPIGFNQFSLSISKTNDEDGLSQINEIFIFKPIPFFLTIGNSINGLLKFIKNSETIRNLIWTLCLILPGLILFFLTKKIKNQYLVIILMFIIYLGLLSYTKLIQFYSFTEKSQLDFATFNTAFINTTHGKEFFASDLLAQKHLYEMKIEGFRNIFGHNHSIIIFLLPFYFLLPRPETLIFLQILILSLGTFPIYWLGKKYLHSSTVSLSLSFLYLLYPILGQIIFSSDGFRPEALSLTFILFAIWFLEENKFFKFLIAILLALSCSLTVAPAIFLLGFWALFKKRPIKWFVSCFSLSILFAVFWSKVIPQMVGLPKNYLVQSYYSHLGKNTSEIIKNIIFYPLNDLKIIFASSNLAYLNRVFQPLGYIPLLGLPYLVFTIPGLLRILLIDPNSGANTSNLFVSYYLASIIPFIFLALVKGLAILKRFKKLYFWLLIWLFASFIFAFFTRSPLFLQSQTYRPRSIKNSQAIWQLIKKIPPAASAATNNSRYLSALSNREKVILFNSPDEKIVNYPEYVLFDSSDDVYLDYEVNPKLSFPDRNQMEEWFLGKGFFLIDNNQNIFLFRRR